MILSSPRLARACIVMSTPELKSFHQEKFRIPGPWGFVDECQSVFDMCFTASSPLAVEATMELSLEKAGETREIMVFLGEAAMLTSLLESSLLTVERRPETIFNEDILAQYFEKEKASVTVTLVHAEKKLPVLEAEGQESLMELLMAKAGESRDAFIFVGEVAVPTSLFCISLTVEQKKPESTVSEKVLAQTYEQEKIVAIIPLVSEAEVLTAVLDVSLEKSGTGEETVAFLEKAAIPTSLIDSSQSVAESKYESRLSEEVLAQVFEKEEASAAVNLIEAEKKLLVSEAEGTKFEQGYKMS
ncbi:unnamed protein product [Soboliphyme baturini]|uniref:RPGR1_C domain-containing protein n=1 Tax=Soboliphyme baturini TaxID=241478 RepID=A0A183J791_9BILA|nr:unnamed protein product [Soboliphyme baturini]